VIGLGWHNRLGYVRGWFDQLSSAVLAVLLALLIWLVANEDARPIESAVFPPPVEDGLSFEFQGVPDGLAPYDPNKRTVRLRLRGLAEALEGLSPTRFELWADLVGVEPADRTVTVPLLVRCREPCRRRGLRVVEVMPATVTTRLGLAVTRTVSVVLEPPDSLASESLLVVSSTIEPSEVVLSGAGAAVARVQRAAAVPAPSDVSRLASEADPLRAVPVVPLDDAGQPVPDVQVDPAEVDVWLVKRLRTDVFGVVPDIRNEDRVAAGYFSSERLVEPQLVELEGSRDALRQIQRVGKVFTIPVDLTGASGRFEQLVALDLPPGVAAINAPEGVTLTVEIEALPGTVTLDVPVRVRWLRDGLRATVTPEQVQVLLSGPRPELEQITSDDLAAFVDLSGKGLGTHRLRVHVDLPPNVSSPSTTPGEVEVVVSEATEVRPTPSAAATATADR